MSHSCPDDLLIERGALMRHLAEVQSRVSYQFLSQERYCRALEKEVMQWRARWMISTTQMLWGLGWATLKPPAVITATRHHFHDSHGETAEEVLCQIGCVSHAHVWRGEDGVCKLTGHECTRVPASAQEKAVSISVPQSTS